MRIAVRSTAAILRAIFAASSLLPKSVARGPVVNPQFLRPEGSLDQDASRLIGLINALMVVPLHKQPLPLMRLLYNALSDAATPTTSARTSRSSLTLKGRGGRPLKSTIYRVSASPRYPLIIYWHGGGFVLGGLDGYDRLFEAIAVRSDANLIAIEYGLAPEYPFTLPVEDALCGYRSLLVHLETVGINPASICVAGDSAGAMLAAIVALDCGSFVRPPDGQMLIYPVVDIFGEYESVSLFGQGLLLTSALLDRFRHEYTRNLHTPHHPWANLLSRSDLHRSVPAVIIQAGYDSLSDQAEKYHQALQNVGRRSHLLKFHDLPHGFMNLGRYVPAADLALSSLCSTLISERAAWCL